ncbi:uncharacterized protein [Arachis hypogaea]|uniref:uncharacterized protein isoform X1 n=1 Tax=Arachis hypogaea TaxID=3818 RepID=UPI003B2268A0
MVGKRLSITLTIIFAAISFSTAISAYVLSRKCKGLKSKILELETSLKSSLEKRAFERQRRIRTQQLTYYPMAPIGTICSCFSTRNGTPRQSLLVPLATACLVFNATRVSPAYFEGLAEYSHCWVLYVFHLNIDLKKL